MLAPYHTLNVASYFHCPIHAKVLSGGSVIKGDRGNGGQGFTSRLSRGLPQSQEDRFVIGLTLRWYCLFPKFARRFRVLRLSVPLVQSFAHLWPVSCCSLSCHSILCSSFVFFFLLRSLRISVLVWAFSPFRAHCTGQVVGTATHAEWCDFNLHVFLLTSLA